MIEFLPLIPREMVARFTATSVELGVYQYDLKMIATGAAPERNIHFRVGLGSNQVQTFRFQSFAKSRTEYTCKIDNPDFSVEKLIVAPPAGISC